MKFIISGHYQNDYLVYEVFTIDFEQFQLCKQNQFDRHQYPLVSILPASQPDDLHRFLSELIYKWKQNTYQQN